MHLWTYLVLRNGGGEALSQMIQSKNWNTDACTKAGEAVLALNKLDPYQPGYTSATYNNEAAAVGNGKAAMELMGQWAPAVQKDQQREQAGPRRQARLVPVPGRDRWRRRTRPTASAAATASPSARMRRPKRSTS